jgi:hypothetical protein
MDFHFFYLYNVHDIYYTSIIIVDVRSGQEGFTVFVSSCVVQKTTY